MHQNCNHNDVNESLQKAEEICQEKGLRFTEIRKKIFRLILENKAPIKAYEILDVLKKKDKSVKPPTVYRALDFLLESGIAHRLASLNSYVGCSHPQKHKQCYFLICSNCHKAVECCNSKLLKAIDATTQEVNFVVETVSLEVVGKCQECVIL